MSRLRLFALLLFWPLAGMAQTGPGELLWEELVSRTPGGMLKAMRHDPDAFVVEAAGVILGYGDGQGIDAKGLEDAVLAARARLRGRELRRMLTADLDGDFAVDARELQIALKAASATMRGRLLGWHMEADRNGDGLADWAEITSFAQVAALKGFSDSRAEAIRRLMIFDLDSNGIVTVGEVRKAVSVLGEIA